MCNQKGLYMDIKAKAAGKMAALTEGVGGTKRLEAKSKAHQVAVRTKYDIRLMLNRLHQAGN